MKKVQFSAWLYVDFESAVLAKRAYVKRGENDKRYVRVIFLSLLLLFFLLLIVKLIILHGQ